MKPIDSFATTKSALRAEARVLVLLGSLLTQSISVTANAQSASPPSFAELCASPGVVSCVGFDNSAEVDPWIVPAAGDIVRASLDTDIKASGDASLRFEIPGFTGSNNSGSWMGPMGANFSQNESFYILFKQRFSKEMLDDSITWAAGFKQVIFHARGKSCGAIELTTQNVYSRNFPQMYTSCGARQLQVIDDTGILLQQGDYNCYYGNYNSQDCGFYRDEEWITFYWEVEIGTWLTETSSIRAYIGYGDGPLQQYIDMPNFLLSYNDDPSDSYSTVQLTSYATDKPSEEDHPTAYTWYDDLVISTQPLPYPKLSNTVRPNPPENLMSE